MDPLPTSSASCDGPMGWNSLHVTRRPRLGRISRIPLSFLYTFVYYLIRRGNALTIFLSHTIWMSRHASEARWCALSRDIFYIEIHQVVFAGDAFFWEVKKYFPKLVIRKFSKGKSMRIDFEIWFAVFVFHWFPIDNITFFRIGNYVWPLRKNHLLQKLLDGFQYKKYLVKEHISALPTHVST